MGSGFMLPDFGNVIEHVTKWLSLLVMSYLEADLQKQDYTAPIETFIKST